MAYFFKKLLNIAKILIHKIISKIRTEQNVRAIKKKQFQNTDHE